MRYLDSNAKDLIPRKDGVWTSAATIYRMIASLKASNQKVPQYLASMAPNASAKLETATFAMHCYWEGEGLLGSIDGVFSTRSAWRGGLEVVDVLYDPTTVDYETLVESAQSMKCASKIFAHTQNQLDTARKKVGKLAVAATGNQRAHVAKDSDQKYYLQHSVAVHLPLSETQATKINASLKTDTDGRRWLSPRQLVLLDRIIAIKQKDTNALKGYTYSPQDIAGYWDRLEAKLAELE